jgi:uncharacterized RDD family membrane protein YckC/outer membrane protein assembly factor BamB
MPRIDKNAVKNAEKNLSQLGFSHLLDYEDKSRAQTLYERLYINRSFNAYAKILISRLSGKILQVTFLAITSGKKVVEYSNVDGIEELDQHIIMKYYPRKSISQLWQTFSCDIQKIHEERLCPEPNFAMPIFYQIRINIIESGIKRGIFQENDSGKNSSAIIPCYNHPASIAIRKCNTCGIAICEACFKMVNGNFYCAKCTPAETTIQKLNVPWGYAGVAIRFCALLVDILITTTVFAVVYFIIQFCLKFTNPPHPNLIIFIAAQPFMFLFLFWHNFYRVARKGNTLGKALFGLRIVSNKGNAPGFATATIRFFSILLTVIFIFPIIGYAVIPFHRKKRGFQDKLSGSMVITKNPRRKAIVAWIFSAPLVIFIIILSTFFISNLVNTGNNFIASKIDLPVLWEIIRKNNDDRWNLTIREQEKRCIISDTNSITCLDMWKGDTIWRNCTFHAPRCLNNDTITPLLITEAIDTTESTVAQLDKCNGSIIWKQKLTFHYFWNFLIDSSYVAAYVRDQIVVLNHNGRIVWERKLPLPDKEKYYSISAEKINNTLLIKRYDEDEDDSITNVVAFNIQNGEEIDSAQNWDNHFPINIGNGFQCTINNDRHCEVRSTNSDSILFSIKDTLENIEKCSIYSNKNGHSSVLFYGKSRAYNRDGTIAFKYPEKYSLYEMTEKYMLFSGIHFNEQSGKYINELMLVDKFSGLIVKTISDSAYSPILNVSETDHALFLKTHQKKLPEKRNKLSFLFNPQRFSPITDLIIIDKNDFSLKKITLGKNIISFIPSNVCDEIFIQCYDRCGVYKIPE